jgi:hypothetical protein
MKCLCGGVEAVGKALAATRRRPIPLYPMPRANLLYSRAFLYSRSESQNLKRQCGWPTQPAVIVQCGRSLKPRTLRRLPRKHNHVVYESEI